jgi:hypothetical protein
MEKHKPFGQLQWRLDSTRRAYYRALHALQQIEASPAPEPDPPALAPPSLPPSPQITSPQIGFVPPTPALLPPVKRDNPCSVAPSEENSPCKDAIC